MFVIRSQNNIKVTQLFSFCFSRLPHADYIYTIKPQVFRYLICVGGGIRLQHFSSSKFYFFKINHLRIIIGLKVEPTTINKTKTSGKKANDYIVIMKQFDCRHPTKYAVNNDKSNSQFTFVSTGVLHNMKSVKRSQQLLSIANNWGRIAKRKQIQKICLHYNRKPSRRVSSFINIQFINNSNRMKFG